MTYLATPGEQEPPTVARSVFAIHIVPLKSGLGVHARKLHIALAQLAGQQYQRLERSQREAIDAALRDYVAKLRSGKRQTKPSILLQPNFFADLSELAEAVGYDVKNARHLWPALQSLVDVPVRFNSLRHSAAAAERELFPDELEVSTSLLSSVVRAGRGVVSWAYDPKILGIMVAPKTYAMLNMELVRNARTYTALALYENCRRFVGIGRAGPYSFERWQHLLSPEGHRPAWENQYEFLRRVKRAIAELQGVEGCDIEIEVQRVKLPDVGVGLQFLVKPLDQPKLPFGAPLPRNRDLVARLTAAGVTQAELPVMIDTHGEEYLLTKLDMLDKAAKGPERVRSPRAWLLAAVAKDFQDEDLARQRAAQSVMDQEARARQSEQVRQAFQAFQAQWLRERFSSQDEATRVRWEVAFAESETGVQALALTPKAREASFFGWLAQQEHGLLTTPEERDVLAFALAGRG